MATYQILYWHDIPIQVRSGRRRNRVSMELPQRFQVAIDNAAMASNLTGTDAYLEAFMWSEPMERKGSGEEVVQQVVAELNAAFPKIDWQKTAKSISKL
ncbi:MAG: hypothetical protein GWP61_26005 [Chloroflexi bacterium]|jgi:hypothetical protein|nr:hypothetical protein [Chloroflexota bacterium]